MKPCRPAPARPCGSCRRGSPAAAFEEDPAASTDMPAERYAIEAEALDKGRFARTRRPDMPMRTAPLVYGSSASTSRSASGDGRGVDSTGDRARAPPTTRRTAASALRSPRPRQSAASRSPVRRLRWRAHIRIDAATGSRSRWSPRSTMRPPSSMRSRRRRRSSTIGGR